MAQVQGSVRVELKRHIDDWAKRLIRAKSIEVAILDSIRRVVITYESVFDLTNLTSRKLLQLLNVKRID
jgi:hypothetical protein